jgi:hypothetical protein
MGLAKAPTKTYYVTHGHLSTVDGDVHKGELVELDFKSSRYLLQQKIVKFYDPATDKVVPSKKESGHDRHGQPLPSREEYATAGYDPSTYEEYCRIQQADPEDPSKAQAAPPAPPKK